MWTYGIVWQSLDNCHTLSLSNEPLIIPALLTSTLLRCVELWMNSLTKTGYCTFPPFINPLSFFTHSHFLEVWKCGTVWQIQDVHVVAFSPVMNSSSFFTMYSVLHFSWSMEVWNNLTSKELSKEWQGAHDWGKCETISCLCQTIQHFHTSTPLRSEKLGKEWQGASYWVKKYSETCIKWTPSGNAVVSA